MPAEPARVEELFNEALSRGTAELRADYLSRACGNDTHLRHRVEALLSAHAAATGGGFFEPAHLHTTVGRPAPLSERPGTRIGRYKLLQQIGEGGFGVVFMAEQEHPIRRRVALKIIKLGMDTHQVVARFEAERQALAMMEHPNVAKVLDGGATDTGRPYFVMELVKGAPITQYCDEHHLTPRDRLVLFVSVCHAVQHAHQKGIIHRDLKPGNVLVAEYDEKPVPKVIDFGVAKAVGQQLTDKTMFTSFGQVIGTMEYMSPEHAKLNQLDIDTRSDVYSLGVILYELLTGQTPFDRKRLQSAAFDEMLRIIREEEPLSPSTKLSHSQTLPSVAANRHTEPARLTRLIRGELDWIVMKSLDKDRSRRYETATGLAADVQRYLDDEAVQACPPSAGYRFRRFVRRNKRPMFAIAAIALALIVGSAFSVAGFVQANRQRRLAQANEARARSEAAKATAVSDFLQRMLRSADPDDARGADYTVRRLLDDISAGIGTEFSQQPEVEAALRTTIGRAYRRLGALDTAHAHLERAVMLQQQLHGDEHEAVAQGLLFLAWNHGEARRLDIAESTARKALQTYRKLGIDGRPLLYGLWTQQWILTQQQNWAEAQAVAEEALAGADAAGIACPELASIIHTTAASLLAQSMFIEAEAPARRAIEMHQRLNGPSHPETAWALSILGATLAAQGRQDEAELPLQQALSIFRQHYNPHHHSVQRTSDQLRSVLGARRDQAALDKLTADLLGDSARIEQAISANAELWFDLAAAQAQMKLWAQAADNSERAWSLAAGSSAESRRELFTRCLERADAIAATMRKAERHADASQVLERAIAMADSLGPDQLPPARLTQSFRYHDVGFCFLSMGRAAEAKQAVQNAVRLKSALVFDFPRNSDYRFHLAHSHLGLSIIHEGAGRRPDALDALRESAGLIETVTGEVLSAPAMTAIVPVWLPGDTAKTLRTVAERFSALGDHARAESLCRQSLRIFEQLERARPSEPYFRQEQGFSQLMLADFCEELGRPREAQGHLETALRLYTALVAQFPQRPFYRQEVAFSTWRMAGFLARDGRTVEALAAYRAAVTLHEQAVTELPNESVLRERLPQVRRDLAELVRIEAAGLMAPPTPATQP